MQSDGNGLSYVGYGLPLPADEEKQLADAVKAVAQFALQPPTPPLAAKEPFPTLLGMGSGVSPALPPLLGATSSPMMLGAAAAPGMEGPASPALPAAAAPPPASTAPAAPLPPLIPPAAAAAEPSGSSSRSSQSKEKDLPPSPPSPRSTDLGTLFSSFLSGPALAGLLAPPAAAGAQALPPAAPALSMAGVEGRVDALDNILRPPRRLHRTAPQLLVDRNEFWRAWRRVQQQRLSQRSSAASANTTSAHSALEDRQDPKAEDEDEDEEERGERSREAQRRKAEEEARGLQLLRDQEADMLANDLASFVLPTSTLTAEEALERRAEAVAWSLGIHDLWEEHLREKRERERVPPIRMAQSLLSEEGARRILKEAVKARMKGVGAEITWAFKEEEMQEERKEGQQTEVQTEEQADQAMSTTTTSPSSSQADTSSAPSSAPSSPSASPPPLSPPPSPPASVPSSPPLPSSLSVLLPPDRCEDLSSHFDGIEQRHWEVEIQWGEHVPSREGAFVSLAEVAAGSYPKKKYVPPAKKKEDVAGKTEKTSKEPSASDLASTFTYLPAASTVASKWVEVPWPEPAPPQPALSPSSPPIPAASPPPSYSSSPLPYYPQGGAPGPMGMSPPYPGGPMGGLGGSAQNAAAAFMNMSFGLQALQAMVPGFMNPYGSPQPPQQQQQFQQQQQMPPASQQQQPAPAQPHSRTIQFSVNKHTPPVAPLLPQPRSVATVFSPADDGAADAAASMSDATKQGWAPAPRASSGLKLLPAQPRPNRPKAFPRKNLPIDRSVPNLREKWGLLALPPADVASIPAHTAALPSSHYLNRDFASMHWLDWVVWDDVASANDPPFHPSDPLSTPWPRRKVPTSNYTRIIWDRNDPHMLFETAEQIEARASKERERLAKQRQEAEGREEEEAAAASTSSTAAAEKGVTLSRFNISNDSHYEHDIGFSSGSRMERVRLAHATFAADMGEEWFEFYRTPEGAVYVQLYPRSWENGAYFLDEEGALATHRPRLPRRFLEQLQQQGAIKLRVIDNGVSAHWSEEVSERFGLDSGAGRRAHKIVPQKMHDLTMTEGGLVLLEYLEQHPPMNLKPGMASRLVTYYRKASDTDEKQIEVEDGDVVILGKNDPTSPFLGDIRPGQSVQAINNNLFVAPMAKHAPPSKWTPALGPPQKDLYCTFMLVRNGKKWYIRNLPTPYIVGQLEPKKIVPQPHRNYALDLMHKYIHFTLMKLFYYKNQVTFDEVASLFDREHEPIIRRGLKELGSFHRAGTGYSNSEERGVWTYKVGKEMPSIEKIRQLFTPEEVCLYESMLAAHARLVAMGIRSFTHPRFVSELVDHIRLPHLQRVALYIEKYLQLTPWYLTKGFVQSVHEGKGTLQLDGRGNPLADGSGYSYISVKPGKKKEDDLPEELKEPTKKTGTDADLRALTMEQMENALLKFGMSASEVKQLKRWDRARAVARFSTEASMEGKHSTMRRFARHLRQTLQTQLAEFKKAACKIFERQLTALHFQLRPDYTHEVLDDPAALQGGEARAASSKLLKSSALSEQREEAEEKRQYREFVEQQMASSSTIDTQADSKPSASSHPDGSRRPTRKVKRKRIKHMVVSIQPDGSSVTVVKYIIDKRLIEYHELDLKDGGSRLKQALGLLSAEEKRAVAAAGGAIVPPVDKTHIYDERTGETTTHERSDEVSGRGRGGGPGRGRGRGRGYGYRDRDDDDLPLTSGRGRGRGRGRRSYHMGDDRGGGGDHHRGAGGAGGEDDWEHEDGRRRRRRGAGSEEDYDQMDEGSDDEEAFERHKPTHLGQKDTPEFDPVTKAPSIRCGACGQLGHSQYSMECVHQIIAAEKEAAALAATDDLYYEEEPLPRGGRGGGGGRGRGRQAAEEYDDAVAKGLIAPTASGAVKLNIKAIAQVPQTAVPKAGRGYGRRGGRDEDEFFTSSGRRGKRGRSQMEEVYLPGKRFRGAGRRRGDAKVSLNSVFSSVLDYASSLPFSEMFREPVDPAFVPDYHGIIKQPMDLRTMKNKASSQTYTSQEEFLADARLLASNSLLYNGNQGERGNITRSAEEIVKIIEQQLRKPVHANKLREAALQYEQQQLLVRLQECMGVLRNLPSAWVTFGNVPDHISNYLQSIAQPMSLSMMDERVRNGQYNSLAEFMFDLDLMARNAAQYNGPQHSIAKQAQDIIKEAKRVMSQWYGEAQMQPREHYIQPPTHRQSSVQSAASSAAASGAGATPASFTGSRMSAARLNTPRFTTPRRSPTRRTPVRNTPGRTTPRRNTPGRSSPGRNTPQRTPSMLASPGPMAMGVAGTPSLGGGATGKRTSQRTPAAATPQPLQLHGNSPTRLDMGSPGPSAAAPTSPRSLHLPPDVADMQPVYASELDNPGLFDDLLQEGAAHNQQEQADSFQLSLDALPLEELPLEELPLDTLPPDA